jgi:hypothetical protein
MRNKNNGGFDEKIGMLHCFVVEHCQGAVLLVDRSYWNQGSV